MAKRKRKQEAWIGVVSLLPDGERFAVAWVRRSDEWLADTGVAERGNEIDTLVRMYRDAVTKRGHEPDVLNVRASVHAAAVRQALGPGVPIKAGFDRKAQALSDAAATAVDIAFDAAMDDQSLWGDEVADEADDEWQEALAGVECAYDLERAPDPATWVAMEESERQLHVRLAHARAGEDLPDRRGELHAGMHEAVENQIAQGAPPETTATVARLQREGLGRHDAVHAVASVFVAEMHDILASQRDYDQERYVAALRALTADGWLER
jgi:hypothetical protein